jgi:hypothetical protein
LSRESAGTKAREIARLPDGFRLWPHLGVANVLYGSHDPAEALALGKSGFKPTLREINAIGGGRFRRLAFRKVELILQPRGNDGSPVVLLNAFFLARDG